MPFAELRDVRLFYTDDHTTEDDTPPLLLVHGWGADSQEWVWHIPELAARHRVIACDLRGHGHSTVPSTGYRPHDFAEDLIGLLDHLGIETVVAVGHSMGGQLVSVLAVEHPDRVKALVCVEPGYGFTAEVAAPFPQMVEALRGPNANAAAVAIDEWSYTPATAPMIERWHIRRLLAMPPHVLAEAFAAMFTADGQFGVRPAAEEYLARRSCPILSFWFDPDQAAWERELFQHPASTIVSWPGAGHRLHEERPREFLLVVDNWLSTID